LRDANVCQTVKEYSVTEKLTNEHKLSTFQCYLNELGVFSSEELIHLCTRIICSVCVFNLHYLVLILKTMKNKKGKALSVLN